MTASYPLIVIGLILALLIVIALEPKEERETQPTKKAAYPRIRGYAAYNGGRPGAYSHVIVEYDARRVEPVAVEEARRLGIPFSNPSWSWENMPIGDDVTSRHGEKYDPKLGEKDTHELW